MEERLFMFDKNNFKKQQKLGEDAENLLRIESELAGLNFQMVNKTPKYYHLGDILILQNYKIKQDLIIEVKGDYLISNTGNILFEHSFKKPVNEDIKITQYNKNAIAYNVRPGWLQNGEYKKIVYYDMAKFKKFIINFSAAKEYISANKDNPQKVTIIKDSINKGDNKLATYYLIKHQLLHQEGILEYKTVNPLLSLWLEDNYNPNDSRMNWIMNNLHFIQID